MNTLIYDILMDVWIQRLDAAVATRRIEAITSEQAEAYADARVRQALEEAAKILDNESERYEQKAQEIMHDDPDEVPHMRSTAWRLSVCARNVRALIPKEDI